MKTQLKNAQYSQQYFYVAFADGMWLLVIFSGVFLCAKKPRKIPFLLIHFFFFLAQGPNPRIRNSCISSGKIFVDGSFFSSAESNLADISGEI
jgi:hypothetical protein